MEFQNIFLLIVLMIILINRLCYAGVCKETYSCASTCYRSQRTTTSCWLIGRCSSYKRVGYSCTKTCTRDICCPGYTGSSCSTPICFDSTDCPNAGSCTSPDNCACVTGFSSPACTDINECASSNGGCAQVCSNTHGSFQCSCNTGYLLSSNTKSCIDKNECNLGTSGCEHICTNTVGGYKCSCREGYQLNNDQKKCSDVDECSGSGTSQCQHKCTNTPGSYTCSCNDGFTIALDQKQCIDIDECTDGKAQCTHTCQNNVGSYLCICNVGYILSTDGYTCIDVDECTVNNGGCGQICNNIPGLYSCACNSGYDLQTDRQTCSDLDECSLSSSGCSQTCTNTVGSFTCSCTDGYNLRFDGRTCDDIDDCLEVECSNRGLCVDAIAKYKCVCDSGFTGLHCENDMDECSFLNGGCQDICTNTEGSFYCSCSENRTLAVNGISCTGGSSSASVFERHSLSRRLLPHGCSSIVLSSCKDGNNITLSLSSTTTWFELKLDQRISFTQGIVFVEVGFLSIPVSLTGVTVLQMEDRFSIEMTTNGHLATDGHSIGTTKSTDCLSFDFTSSDIFEFISSNSFFVSFLASIVPAVPEWLEFASTNHSILNTQDLRTDMVYGRDIDNTAGCQGAPVLHDHLYSVFRFGSAFKLSIYGDTVEIPQALKGEKFCVIIDICQNTGGTIFLMIPYESRMILTHFEYFNASFQNDGLLIIPKGIGISLVNGIQANHAEQQIQVWNGDHLFNYPVFKTADLWIGAEVIKNQSVLEIKAKASLFVNIPNINRLLMGVYLDEWNVLATLDSQATLKLKFSLFKKQYTIPLNFATASLDAYVSIGGTESRQWCGDISNPPGMFMAVSLKLNPFQGVPILEDWVFDFTNTVYAYVTTDPVSTINYDTNIDILQDIIQLEDRLERFEIAFKSAFTNFGDLLLNNTKIILTNVGDVIIEMKMFISASIAELKEGHLSNVITILMELWSKLKEIESSIKKYLDAIEYSVDVVSDELTSFINNEVQGFRFDINTAVMKLSSQVNALVDGVTGFGLKYRATISLFGLRFFGLDIELVYSTSNIGQCSRFDAVYSLLEGEPAARILGTLSQEISLGFFLKAEQGIGIGGAFAISSDKWIFQINVYINIIGIKTTADVFISSDKKLHLYIEGNVWGIFLAQIDISAEIGKEWYQLTFRLEGRLVAKARKRRQTQEVSSSFQASYLDALKKAVSLIGDEAEKRLSQVQQGLSIAQNGLSKAQNWLNDKKTDVRNANVHFDNVVNALESVKQKLEDAKGPFERALKKLKEAQRNVDKLCKIRKCGTFCIPGIKIKICRWGWFRYPCIKFTSCMIRLPNPVCVLANLVCHVLRGIAFLALEVAKIFVRIPMLALDVAKVAVSVAQIVVDKSRIVLVLAEGILDFAIIGLEGAKIILESAKIALEAVKLVIGVAVKVLEFVIEYGLKNILDVRNCGFSIEVSTTDLPIFDVSCEINAFKLGWKTVRLRINFQNIIQSIWQSAKATIKVFMSVIGDLFTGRKRREIEYESTTKMHNILRRIRASGGNTDFLNSTSPNFNETIDIIGQTLGIHPDLHTNFESRVLLFAGKCETISKVKGLLKDAFKVLYDIANETNSDIQAAMLFKDQLQSYNIENVTNNATLENSGISLEYAKTDYNLTADDVANAFNEAITSAKSDPLLLEIETSTEFIKGNIETELASAESIYFLNHWLNAMDNITTDYFEETECFGFRDCVFHSISTLYDLFTAEDHPNITEIETAISTVEDNILELFSNTSHNISSIYNYSGSIDTNIRIIVDLNMFCSTPPTIMTHLANQTVVVGSNMSLTCHITSDPMPVFWWYTNDTMMVGENSEILLFVNLTYEDEGMYKCMAGNIIGNVTSDDAYLRVVAPLPLEQEHSSFSVVLAGAIGGSVLLVIVVTSVSVCLLCRYRRDQRKRRAKHNSIRSHKKDIVSDMKRSLPAVRDKWLSGIGNATLYTSGMGYIGHTYANVSQGSHTSRNNGNSSSLERSATYANEGHVTTSRADGNRQIEAQVYENMTYDLGDN